MIMVASKILAYCSGKEEDEDHGGSYPEGAIEIGIAIKDIEEWAAGYECRETAMEDVGGVDGEELGVK